MFVTDVNDVKIYNLSAGKSLPEVNNIFLPIYLKIIQHHFTYSGFLKKNDANS